MPPYRQKTRPDKTCFIPPPKPKRTQEKSQDEHARLYGRRWCAFRLQYLARPDNQYCRICRAKGKPIWATVIDHIVPYRQALTAEESVRLFWDETNMLPLCKTHHDQVTYRFDGGYGRPVNPEGKLTYYRSLGIIT